ncbi:MAG: outer membrane protein transport protein, partial [Deltaproteobacteria bacterium]|nr:outer membrane protein transport protein [Deltaproteobacteria bacterium]
WWSYFEHSRLSYKNWDYLNTHFNKGMKDCYRISIGAEYFLKNSLALRVGYLFNVQATHDSWISPTGPDITNHNLGIGLGVKLGNFDIDLGYGYTFIPDKTISSIRSKTGFPGKYESKFSSITMGVNYSF